MITIQVDTYSDSYKQPIIDLFPDIQRNEFGVAITLEAQPDLPNIPSFYQKNDGNFWDTSGQCSCYLPLTLFRYQTN
ncbi:MAG: hypothetical protein ACXWWC_15705 [Chitinophagaceae bacterium]